jgi:hypothetical protein
MEKSIRQTCGSVRSSLSASARLVTVGSKAAETKELRLRARKQPRGSFRNCQHHGGLRAGLGDMSNGSELPTGTVKIKRAKGADRLKPNGNAVGCSTCTHGTRGQKQTAGVQAGTNSSMLLERNTANLTFRPLGAGVVARPTVGVAGRGSWNKRMLSGNRADRGCNITPLRKQADFQQVVRHETAGRTFIGGNRK